MIDIFLMLLFGHYVMDYPFQGDFLARAKNRMAPVPHVPWYQAMFAHAFMHSGVVYFVTGLWWLAVLELVTHFIIDDLKCRGELTFNQDQFSHVFCKIVWVGLLAWSVQ